MGGPPRLRLVDLDPDPDPDLDPQTPRGPRARLRLSLRPQEPRHSGTRGLKSALFMVGVPAGARTPTMNNEQLPFQKLDAYQLAKELARRVHKAQIRDAELRDQATRASKSTFLGLCEGLPSNMAGVRRRHFDIANASLHEVIGALDLVRGHRRPRLDRGPRASRDGDPPQAHRARPDEVTTLDGRARPTARGRRLATESARSSSR